MGHAHSDGYLTLIYIFSYSIYNINNNTDNNYVNLIVEQFLY